ncbi:MAG TPA: GspH/FimT family pseudopilin [Thermoanaerobaculia bacterium]
MNVRRQARSHRSGYSMVEMLVVLALVGIISLVTVPNFISIQRGGRLKSSVNQLAGDLRMARALAVTERARVRVVFSTMTGGPGTRTAYTIWRWNTGTSAWEQAVFNRNQAVRGIRIHRREMQPRCFVSSVTGLAASEVIFRQDGTIEFPAGVSSGRLRVTTDYSKVTVRTYDISVTVTGLVRTDRVA